LNTPESEVDRLAAAFLALTLPKAEWTHEAHLRVGLWHVVRFGADEALDRLRRGIRAYNESIGGINSDSSGYHETITRFYVWRIGRFIESADKSRPLDELAAELIATHGDRELPFRYWSKKRLMSKEARLGWVEPDLGPLT
jgi:hypothetical protein